MVLADLGAKITKALRSMTESVVLDEKVVKSMVSEITMALLKADVDVLLVKKLQTNIMSKVNLEDMAQGNNKRKMIQSTVIQELYKLLDSGGQPYALKKGKPNVIMFVGLQGSGKTTTVCKYAYYYKKRGWKTCMICADTFRAGAFDQLKQNATKAKIPFYGSYTERDPVVVAEAGVNQFRKEKYEVIIVDTSGRHYQEAALFEEMQEVAKVTQPDDIVFVMDSSIGQAAKAQATQFRKAVDVGSVIITKLDGHAKGGGAMSAVAATRSPIIFVGTGEHIEDFEPFNAKGFVSRMLGMGDISGLLHLFEENKMFDQPELYKKLSEGKGDFSFRDMQDQFKNLLKLGPLSQVMSMLPNMGFNLGPGKEKESVNRIKRFITIMDSMTQKELDGDGKIFNTQPDRLQRLARGSGSTMRNVHEVMETYKPFKKVAGKIGDLSKSGVDLNKLAAAGPGRGRQQEMGMRQLQSMFTPQMLQKMGGVGNLQSMMKKFASGGGFPGMPGM